MGERLPMENEHVIVKLNVAGQGLSLVSVRKSLQSGMTSAKNEDIING